MTLIAAGHASGWPILRGGAQTLPDALACHLEDLGGRIEIEHEVRQLPETDLTLADITPRQLLRIAGSQLPSRYCRRLERFRYGAGAFKIDYALSAPIPWTAPECSRAATVHIGGSLEEIVESERSFTCDRPFVLLGQPSLFDPSRAPAGQHTAWAYCHVPNGSEKDCTESIERQIARFAPDFRHCILARSISSPAALERWNPNLVGATFGGAPWISDSFSPVSQPHSIAHRGRIFISAEHQLPLVEVSTECPVIMPLRQRLQIRLVSLQLVKLFLETSQLRCLA